MDKDIAIMSKTETWIKEGDAPRIGVMCPPGYYFIGASRPAHKGSKGGGVGFVLSPHVIATRIPTEEHVTFESVAIRVKGSRPLRVVLIYRPPPSPSNGLTKAMFLDEIETYLSSLFTSTMGDVCVVGDFNVHWETENDPLSARFKDIICTLDVKQLVTKPTHKNGHTLDLFLVHKSCDRVVIEDISDPCLSDHSLILGSVSLNSPKIPVKQVSARPLRRVDV